MDNRVRECCARIRAFDKEMDDATALIESLQKKRDDDIALVRDLGEQLFKDFREMKKKCTNVTAEDHEQMLEDALRFHALFTLIYPYYTTNGSWRSLSYSAEHIVEIMHAKRRRTTPQE